jgi:hypothetical protein
MFSWTTSYRHYSIEERNLKGTTGEVLCLARRGIGKWLYCVLSYEARVSRQEGKENRSARKYLCTLNSGGAYMGSNKVVELSRDPSIYFLFVPSPHIKQAHKNATAMPKSTSHLPPST